jgi:hypothetical protein
MRKLIIVGIAAALALGCATVAFGGDSGTKVVAKPKAAAAPVEKPSAGSERFAALARRVNCRSVGCVNSQLTKLKSKVKNLEHDAFDCEQLVDLTQYYGYLYSPNNGATVQLDTGLDYTAPGVAPSNTYVIYTC